MRHSQPESRRGSFRLVDLVVVVTLVGLILAVFSSGIADAQFGASRVMKCRNQLKHIGLGLAAEQANLNHLPFNDPEDAEPRKTVFHKLAPAEIVGQDFKDAVAIQVKAYMCPDDTSTGKTAKNYAVSSYVLNEAIFRRSPAEAWRSDKAMDQPSATVLVSERLGMCGDKAQTAWADPDLCVFTVPGVDVKTGKATGDSPKGMSIQLGATPKTCKKECVFQTGHARQLNVLRGDFGIISIPADYDPKAMNYNCVPLGRDAWTKGGVKFPKLP